LNLGHRGAQKNRETRGFGHKGRAVPSNKSVDPGVLAPGSGIPDGGILTAFGVSQALSWVAGHPGVPTYWESNSWVNGVMRTEPSSFNREILGLPLRGLQFRPGKFLALKFLALRTRLRNSNPAVVQAHQFLRIAKGWTQEFAERAVMQRSYLADMELGRRNPSVRTLMRWPMLLASCAGVIRWQCGKARIKAPFAERRRAEVQS
jgi:hypothetical protein